MIDFKKIHSGQKIGGLTAKKSFEGRANSWIFVCECGDERIIRQSQVLDQNKVYCKDHHCKYGGKKALDELAYEEATKEAEAKKKYIPLLGYALDIALFNSGDMRRSEIFYYDYASK